MWTYGALAAAPGKVREICFIWVTFHSDSVVLWKTGLFFGFPTPLCTLALQRCSPEPPKMFNRFCAQGNRGGGGGNHCREKATKYYKTLQMLQNCAKFDPEIFLGCPFHEMHKKHILVWRSSRYTPPLIGGFKKTVFYGVFCC